MMALLAHPLGMGFQPSELRRLEADELSWWFDQMERINGEIQRISSH
jgi:hypothetical protein